MEQLLVNVNDKVIDVVPFAKGKQHSNFGFELIYLHILSISVSLFMAVGDFGLIAKLNREKDI